MSDDKPKPTQEQLLVYIAGQMQEMHTRLDSHARALKSIHERLPAEPKPQSRLMRAALALLEWRAAITAVVTLVAAVIQSRRGK